MTDEEVKALQDDLEATRRELEEIKQEKEALSRELEVRDTRISELGQVVADRDSEIATLKHSAAQLDERLTTISDSLAQAVASYKEVLAQANPGIPEELLIGDTVEAVNQSLENAKSIVAKVKQELEAEASRTKIPAGAPQRTPIDLSVLSPREKIQYAIGGNK